MNLDLLLLFLMDFVNHRLRGYWKIVSKVNPAFTFISFYLLSIGHLGCVLRWIVLGEVFGQFMIIISISIPTQVITLSHFHWGRLVQYF